MSLKRHCAGWCWAIYAVPCAGLFLWGATGHAPRDAVAMLLWIYGFPSTALVPPIFDSVWPGTPASGLAAMSVIVGVVNGGVLCLILQLVRSAMETDSEASRRARMMNADRPRLTSSPRRVASIDSATAPGP